MMIFNGTCGHLHDKALVSSGSLKSVSLSIAFRAGLYPSPFLYVLSFLLTHQLFFHEWCQKEEWVHGLLL